MQSSSGKPEISEKEKQVLEIVRNHWPISALEIAKHFRENISSREHKKKHSTNYTYYLKKLVAKRLILSKRIGNALIVWPLEAEHYRAMYRHIKETQNEMGLT